MGKTGVVGRSRTEDTVSKPARLRDHTNRVAGPVSKASPAPAAAGRKVDGFSRHTERLRQARALSAQGKAGSNRYGKVDVNARVLAESTDSEQVVGDENG